MTNSAEHAPDSQPQDILQVLILCERFTLPARDRNSVETIVAGADEMAGWSAQAAALAGFMDSPNASAKVGGVWHLLSLDDEFVAWMNARQANRVFLVGQPAILAQIAGRAQAAGLYRCVLLEGDELSARAQHPVHVAVTLGPLKRKNFRRCWTRSACH